MDNLIYSKYIIFSLEILSYLNFYVSRFGLLLKLKLNLISLIKLTLEIIISISLWKLYLLDIKLLNLLESSYLSCIYRYNKIDLRYKVILVTYKIIKDENIT